MEISTKKKKRQKGQWEWQGTDTTAHSVVTTHVSL